MTPIVLAFVVVIFLFAGAFFLGKWRADEALVTASAPHAVPTQVVTPATKRPAGAGAATSSNGDETAAVTTPKDRP